MIKNTKRHLFFMRKAYRPLKLKLKEELTLANASLTMLIACLDFQVFSSVSTQYFIGLFSYLN